MMTQRTYTHSIDLDYKNELGQRIVVVTCLVNNKTYALVADEWSSPIATCPCGKHI